MTNPAWPPGQPPQPTAPQPLQHQPLMPGMPQQPMAMPLQQPPAQPMAMPLQPQPGAEYRQPPAQPMPGQLPPGAMPGGAIPSIAGARSVHGGTYFDSPGTYIADVIEAKVETTQSGLSCIVVWEIVETDAVGAMVGEAKNASWQFQDKHGYGPADIRHFITSVAEQINVGLEVNDTNADQCCQVVLSQPSPAIGTRWKIHAYVKPLKTPRQDGKPFIKADFMIVPPGTVLGLGAQVAVAQPVAPVTVASILANARPNGNG